MVGRLGKGAEASRIEVLSGDLLENSEATEHEVLSKIQKLETVPDRGEFKPMEPMAARTFAI